MSIFVCDKETFKWILRKQKLYFKQATIPIDTLYIQQSSIKLT
jgi:hypothetical protein